MLFHHGCQIYDLSESNGPFQLYGRAMAELRVLRLFGNPLEFLPEILPLYKLRHLSLANIRIVADDNLRSINVQIEVVIGKTTVHFLMFSILR